MEFTISPSETSHVEQGSAKDTPSHSVPWVHLHSLNNKVDCGSFILYIYIYKTTKQVILKHHLYYALIGTVNAVYVEEMLFLIISFGSKNQSTNRASLLESLPIGKITKDLEVSKCPPIDLLMRNRFVLFLSLFCWCNSQVAFWSLC